MDIKKINFKEKRYVLPLLALPFIFLFVYIGAQFVKEEKPEENQRSCRCLSEKLRILL
jgi:hypothetical protein